jgi:AMP-binding enzyme/AMP-binding enzyme C-terminal domain
MIGPAVVQRDELNFRVVHVYGLTETYGPITVCPEQDSWQDLPLDERARLLARQGQAYICADLVRVADQEMNDVPRDGQTMGEVIMRGNNVMSGYYADQAATDKAFAGGWFHSGDLAVWHPDGNIELRDRGKDIIISGGENISSIEVEQAIAAHPAVLECAAVGIPHEYWGERHRANARPGHPIGGPSTAATPGRNLAAICPVGGSSRLMVACRTRRSTSLQSARPARIPSPWPLSLPSRKPAGAPGRLRQAAAVHVHAAYALRCRHQETRTWCHRPQICPGQPERHVCPPH